MEKAQTVLAAVRLVADVGGITTAAPLKVISWVPDVTCIVFVFEAEPDRIYPPT